MNAQAKGPASGDQLVEEKASTREPASGTQGAAGWQLVSDQLQDGCAWFPVVVGCEPAVVWVDESRKWNPRAWAFRLEDGQWKSFANTELPFSSFVTNLGSRADGSSGLFAATTVSSRGLIVAIELSGFRNTDMKYSPAPDGWKGYVIVAMALIWSLISGIILALVATLLMCRDSARFEFGLQSVELASVGERGCARMIDILLILTTTFEVVRGLVSLLGLDWRTTSEAIAVKMFDHPSVSIAKQIAVAALGCLVVGFVLIVVMQARLSVTPGKWICRLRTVRATLRPCGISRSLMRELLLFLDCLYLFSWTPGILCIYFSKCRQRLGDHLADTLVVRAPSLEQPLK
jgi:uncharacterized RDD family membrane protein YckC